MNKRQSKKKLKKGLELIKSARRDGYGIVIKTQMYVDENGRECDPNHPNARFRKIRPQISYYKANM